MDLGESSTFFRIRCLEFYFPRHSVASLFLSIFPFLSFPLSLFRYFLSLSHSHYISFSFSSLGSHPLASMPRIALLGISEVLSRIQGLASSLMDGSAILFHSTPPPLRVLTIHLSVVAPLRHSVSIRPLDGRLCRVWIHAFAQSACIARHSSRNRTVLTPSRLNVIYLLYLDVLMTYAKSAGLTDIILEMAMRIHIRFNYLF